MKKNFSVLLILVMIFTLLSGCQGAGKEVRLEDDYFLAINKEMIDGGKINPETGEWSATSQLTETTDEKTNEIIRSLAEHIDQYQEDSVEKKIANFYLSARDMKSRNKVGLKGLEGTFHKIEKAKTIRELGNVWAEISTYAFSLPVLPTYDVNPKDANHFIYYISGDTTEYDFSDFDKEGEKAVKTYIAAFLEGYGETKEKAEEHGKRVFDYLKTMSKYSKNNKKDEDENEELETPKEEYFYYTEKELANLYSHLDMKTFLKIHKKNMADFVKVSTKEYLVGDPEFSKVLNEKYLRDDKLELMKEVTIFMVLDSFAGQYQCLPEKFQKANVKMTNYLYGVEEQYDGEKQALEATRFLMEDEVGKLYTDKYFTEAMKKDATKMVKDIWNTYKKKVTKAKWMSEKTKKGAMKKLKHLTINVGYPNGEWGDSVLTANVLSPEQGGDCLSNSIEYLLNSGKFGGPAEEADKEAWPLAVTDVNAMYDPINNSITIPAGILQKPFYDANGDYIANLGSIGATVGHEITHAFDNDGANYDEIGTYRNWWTKEDYKSYRKIQKKMIQYFGNFQINGIHVDGRLTLPENIADLGGMECVLEVVPKDKKSLRKFFESYSKSWASKYTDTVTESLLAGDEHSPDKIRVNGILGTTDAFYEAYDIKKEDKMYIPPKNRVSIWGK